MQELVPTFPQCEVTKQEVLDKLGKSARIEVVGAVIAQETHQDGAHHLHVAIWLKKSTRLPVDYWDFLVGKHGNYARMKNQIGAYKYLHKEDKEPLSMVLFLLLPWLRMLKQLCALLVPLELRWD